MMDHPFSTIRIVAGTALMIAASFSTLRADPNEFFESNIRPLLIEHCSECHSRAKKGGLNLTSRESLLRGGNSGPSIVPGDPKASLLVQAITGNHSDLKMPPDSTLSEVKQNALIRWVASGAPWPKPRPGEYRESSEFITKKDREFWSYQPLERPLIPKVTSDTRISHPIDAFLQKNIHEHRLKPLPRASKQTLVRRAYFDLIGLPPTPVEVTAFEQRSSPHAFRSLIDQLLASPHYGERWGGHWLDLTRYADTAGDAADFPVPEAYRYRNYVIDAFNRDKPYDEFVKEQIAGDLLPYQTEEEHWEQTIATGYIATSRRIGVSPQNLEHITIEDTIDNLGKTFLGLSIGCARCHDHKFDPIPTADYYSLYGIFASSVYPHAGAEHDPYRRDFVYRVGQDSAAKTLAPYQAALAPWNKKERTALRIYRDFQRMKIETPGLTRQSTWQALLEIRDDHRRVAETFPDLEIAYAIQDASQPINAHIMAGGNPSRASQREQVRRGFLDILGGQKVPAKTNASGRLELAQWIATDSNPLTARVIANRVWHHHFGRGLVTSTSDFGIRGSAPSHPRLLDYLAVYLVDHQWSVKQLHRHIMTSAAYQRQSQVSPHNSAIDPENKWLWRFNRQRMTAEQLRDSILFLCGDLDLAPGKAHPFPHRLTYFYRQHEPFTEDYQNNKRTVYRLRRRLEKDPYLDLFDGPDGNQHFAKRRATTTTLQALYFMNGSFVDEQADKLVEHLLAPDQSMAENLRTLYVNLFGRQPSAAELGQIESITANASLTDWSLIAKAMLSSNEFLFIE